MSTNNSLRRLARAGRLVAVAIAPVLALALAAWVTMANRPVTGGATAQVSAYTLAATADPSDGPAYAHEAIANVRGMERFRFTETITGLGGADAKRNGAVTGAVDLSNGSADPPKLQFNQGFHRPDGSAASLDTITVGDQTFMKLPGTAKHQKSARGPKVSRGKAAGQGTGDVDVVDPVMTMLEAIDKLPDDRFATPSAPDADGIRTLQVDLGGSASLVLAIDDAQRLVRKLTFTKGSVTTTMTLDNFGDSTIQIDQPQP